LRRRLEPERLDGDDGDFPERPGCRVLTDGVRLRMLRRACKRCLAWRSRTESE
jgi:hypothetical protein